MNTAFVQVSLKEDHKLGSYEYMERVRRKLADDLPQVATYFTAGGLVDSVVNQGLPAPIDIQVSTNDCSAATTWRAISPRKSRQLRGVSGVLIPQDLDYPGLELDINRERASMAGTSPKEVVGQRDHRAHFQRHDRPELSGSIRNRE